MEASSIMHFPQLHIKHFSTESTSKDPGSEFINTPAMIDSDLAIDQGVVSRVEESPASNMEKETAETLLSLSGRNNLKEKAKLSKYCVSTYTEI